MTDIIAKATILFFFTVTSSVTAENIVFQDCDSCPKMIHIPGGEFLMGSPHSVTQAEKVPSKRAKRERPVHRVRVAAFAIGKYEVMRHQYAVFITATGHYKQGGCKYWTGNKFAIANDKDWRNPGFVQQDNHPAVCISWADAKAYAGWLTAKTGKPYRLPSEAEWEYAARAGSGAPRFWGTNAAEACRFANTFDITGAKSGAFPSMTPHDCSDGFAETAPIGSFSPNAFGLFDMAGNVWEWTEDCWHKNYTTAPSDSRAWIASGRCIQRVLRGGSWISTARFVRSGNRSKVDADTRIYRNGFRIALTTTR